MTHRIEILTKDSTYTLPSAEKPLLVIFDKRNRLIKELNFDKSFDEWKYQAVQASSLVDRIMAIQASSRQAGGGDVATVLNDRMEHDPFWGVRREAVTQAAQLASGSDSLRQLLKEGFVAASKDSRAEVRTSADRALQYYKQADVVALLKNALKDQSYSVINSALTSLARVDSANALPTVNEYLNYPSHQNRVAAAALQALGTLDSAAAMSAAIQRIGDARYIFVRFTALTIIRKYGKGRPDAVDAVKGILGDSPDFAKNYAVQVLGDIGDESVIPSLEAIANDKDNPAHESAKASIEKIKKRAEEKKG